MRRERRASHSLPLFTKGCVVVSSKCKARITLWERIRLASKRDKYLLLMSIPAIVFYFVFHYLPMGGIFIAFRDYKPGMEVFSISKWVGWRWFNQFFSSYFAVRIVRNTFLLALYSLLWGFPIPIIFAICVNEIGNMRLRRFVQTSSYLPYFISTVVMVGIMTNFLNPNNGLIPVFLKRFGIELGNPMMNPKAFRTLYVASGVWQGFGFNSIIYIAAIVGIDPSLYESARIDGITKFKEVWYITLPSIIQTIIILFILSLGNIMNVGFEKVYLMYIPAVYETADVISTYVYRSGIESSNYGFATAVGIFNSVINFLFVFVANMICRKVTNASLW